jgi:hypothetical protein
VRSDWPAKIIKYFFGIAVVSGNEHHPTIFLSPIKDSPTQASIVSTA